MSRNKQLQQWLDNKTDLQSIQSELDARYCDAISLCEDIYTNIKDSLLSITDNEYVLFLSTYANICALKDETLNKEIEIQEAILSIRRRQVELDSSLYAEKLSSSLLYAAELHRRTENYDLAIEYLREKLVCENTIGENTSQPRLAEIGTTQYLLAHIYAHTNDVVEADKCYKECIEFFDLLSKQHNNDNNIKNTFAQVLTELADFYLSHRNVNQAIDRYLQAIDIYMNITPREARTTELLLALIDRLKEIYTILQDNAMAKHYKELYDSINNK